MDKETVLGALILALRNETTRGLGWLHIDEQMWAGVDGDINLDRMAVTIADALQLPDSESSETE